MIAAHARDITIDGRVHYLLQVWFLDHPAFCKIIRNHPSVPQGKQLTYQIPDEPGHISYLFTSAKDRLLVLMII